MTEFLFFDEQGLLNISEERVKTLYGEFTSIMKSVYKNVCAEYENIVHGILTDADYDKITFPLVPERMNLEGLGKFLKEDLAKKLNIIND